MMSLKDVSERTSAVNDVIDSCACVHTPHLPHAVHAFLYDLVYKGNNQADLKLNVIIYAHTFLEEL